MRFAAWITPFWLVPLAALQSIPGTGALRTLFLLAGALHLALWWRRVRPAPLRLRGAAEAWLWAALTVWLAVHATLLALDTVGSLGAFAREWTKLALMFVLGALAARLHAEQGRAQLLVALFLGAFVHVVATLAAQIESLAQGSGLAWGRSLLGNYGYASPFVTAAFLWLVADGAARLCLGRRLLPWPGALTAFLASLALAAEALLGAKAGIGLSLVLGLAVAAGVAARRALPAAQRVGFAAFLAGALVLVLAVNAPRWQGALAAAAAGWRDAAADEFWKRSMHNPPFDAAGQSFYVRAGWLRAGLEGIAQRPLGSGYASDAFGRHVADRHGVQGMVSSHSGWVDFALANGIPGLALLAALYGVLIRRGLRAFGAGEAAGLVLALFALHGFLRAAIDGTLHGSRFTGAALTLGALWLYSARSHRAPATA